MVTSPEHVQLRNRRLAAVLAWLVPGLGHAYQKRYGKAALYAICILGLYAYGLYLGGGKIVFWTWVNPLRDIEHFRLYYLGQVFVGLASLPALIQATLQQFGMAPILWGFLAEPTPAELNAIYPAIGSKLVEVGLVYTTVAGLLNILAIFDAAAGPALESREPDVNLSEATSTQRAAPAETRA